jgi:serine/threonine-protein kinase
MSGDLDLLGTLRDALADRYLVEREVGRGGMAAVYRAEDPKHGRTVAIKVLSPELSATIGAERFQREIQIAARLSHPHILPVHDSGEAAGLLYYVMPFVEGESLRQRLDRETQLGIDDAIAITCEVADALAYAHTQGVVHRDVKPENVLLFGGHAVVTDFGIARAASEAGSNRLTATGMSLGTAAYMSPEQFVGEQVDGRADVYSLACMLYEMLVGQVPFTGPNAIVIMARATVEMAPSIRVVRSSVPPELEDVIMRALEKVPADRFPTMQAFKDALLGGGSGGYVRRTTRYTMARTGMYAAEPETPWWRRPRGVLAAAGIALALVGAAGTGFFLNARSSRDAAGIVQAGDVAGTLVRNRVAVMYFDDLSATESLATIATGLTESLIGELRTVGALDVVSPDGVRALRGASLDSIASTLKARLVVRGSIEPRGDALRVKVRLIDVASGDEVRSASFDRPRRDVVGIRDSVARQVADLLRREVGDEVRLAELRRSTRDAESWLLVRRAERALRAVGGVADSGGTAAATASLRGVDSLLAAAEGRDPEWVEPVVLRARTAYRVVMLTEATGRGGDAMREALAHAERARRLAPKDPAVLELLGTLHYGQVYYKFVQDPAEERRLLELAEQELVAATTLDPSRATAWQQLGDLRIHEGDFPGAAVAARQAYEKDAWLESASDILWQLFSASYEQEDFVSADYACRQGIARFPQSPRFVRCELFMLTTSAREPGPRAVSDAWHLAGRWQSLVPAEAWQVQGRLAHGLVSIVLARSQLGDSALRVIARNRASGAADPKRSLLQYEAYVHVLRGEKDQALRLLEEYLAVNPEVRASMARRAGWWWRDIKDDPRFRALVQTRN